MGTASLKPPCITWILKSRFGRGITWPVPSTLCENDIISQFGCAFRDLLGGQVKGIYTRFWKILIYLMISSIMKHSHWMCHLGQHAYPSQSHNSAGFIEKILPSRRPTHCNDCSLSESFLLIFGFLFSSFLLWIAHPLVTGCITMIESENTGCAKTVEFCDWIVVSYVLHTWEREMTGVQDAVLLKEICDWRGSRPKCPPAPSPRRR